jgi:methylated-DNA-[protein]-cysteine S-methyltransferase
MAGNDWMRDAARGRFSASTPANGRLMKARVHQFTLSSLPSPIGEMRLVTDAFGQLRALDWHDHEDRLHRLLTRQYKAAQVTLAAGAAPPSIRDALEAYFSGLIHAIVAIEVETGGTEFQKQAWAALRQIPAGETTSYSEQASRIGRPQAVRAVGLANGANPVGLVVPCHRVIGANGTLTGYGGGLDRKRWLLGHEGLSFK